MIGSAKQNSELSDLIRQFGLKWFNSHLRPMPATDTLAKWVDLLSLWIEDKKMPLLIRKASLGRGLEIQHLSGRILIPTDNSPAHWSYSLALQNICPSMREVKVLLEKHEIPLAFAPKPKEREFFKTNPKALRRKGYNLNLEVWKLAHIDPVGLKSRRPIEEREVKELENHFRKFLDPNNMFVVPIKWSGLAETNEVIEVFRYNRELLGISQ